MPRGRTKGSKNKPKEEELVTLEVKTLEKPLKLADVEGKLPQIIKIVSSELEKYEHYDYRIKGRYWKNKVEILCVELLQKHM